MKTGAKLAISFLTILSIFSSCRSYSLTHYTRNEVTKLSSDSAGYNVYIHDKNNIYKVDKPSFSNAGVRGTLSIITDSATLADLRHVRTRKQLKKHRHDLNVYTKSEIKINSSGVALKKQDISDITHVATKVNIGNDIGLVIILGLGVVVWYGVFYSFNGLL